MHWRICAVNFACKAALNDGAHREVRLWLALYHCKPAMEVASWLHGRLTGC